MYRALACAVALALTSPAHASLTRVAECPVLNQLYANLDKAKSGAGWKVTHYTGAAATALGAVLAQDMPEWWAVEQPNGVVLFADDPATCMVKRAEFEVLEWAAVAAAAGVEGKAE